jgi:hypothetical protein
MNEITPRYAARTGGVRRRTPTSQAWQIVREDIKMNQQDAPARIGVFLRSFEESYSLHLPGFRRAMDELSRPDSVFHPQVFNDEQIEEIPLYAAEYGIRSFKFYMSGVRGIVKSVSDDVLLRRAGGRRERARRGE